jgi:hypothetical protein
LFTTGTGTAYVSIYYNYQFLTRKSSGGHQAKRRKEEKTYARGTGRYYSYIGKILGFNG